MHSKKHLPDIEQWSQSSGSNVISRRARPRLAGLRPHKEKTFGVYLDDVPVHALRAVVVILENVVGGDPEYAHLELHEQPQPAREARQHLPERVALQGHLAHMNPPHFTPVHQLSR